MAASSIGDDSVATVGSMVELLTEQLSGLSVDDSHTAAESRGITNSEKDLVTKRLRASVFHTVWHHIPFRYTSFTPLGCSSSHAFATYVDENNELYLTSLNFSDLNRLDTPFCAFKEKRPFDCPWSRLRLERPYYSSWVHKNSVLLCDKQGLTVIYERSNHYLMVKHAMPSITNSTCSMNDDYIALIARETQDGPDYIYFFRRGTSAIELLCQMTTSVTWASIELSTLQPFIFYLHELNNTSTNVTIGFIHAVQSPARSSSRDGSTSTSAELRDEFTTTLPRERYVAEILRNTTLFTKNKPALLKMDFRELSPDVFAQATMQQLNMMYEDGSIYSYVPKSSMICGFAAYTRDVTAVLHQNYAISFRWRLEEELAIVSGEDLRRPFLAFDDRQPAVLCPGQPLVVHPSGRALLMLMHSGCLAVINI